MWKRHSDLDNFSLVSVFGLRKRGGQWRVRACTGWEISKPPATQAGADPQPMRKCKAMCACVCVHVHVCASHPCLRHLLEEFLVPSRELILVNL